MKAILWILLLLILDLATKHIFRFYEDSLDLSLVLIEGYVYVEQVVFNYGNVFSQADGPEDASFVVDAIFYLCFGIAIIGGSITLIASDEEESFWYPIPSIFLIPGALGNTIDKLFYGGICDWLTVTSPESEWENMINLADLFILLGLFGLIFIVFDSWKWRFGGLIAWSAYFLIPLNMRILFFD